MGSTGLVLGKFMPPHRGHQMLVDFARRCVDEVTVVVGSMPHEPIDGALRVRWMRMLFPDCRVLHLHKVLPQLPEEDPCFWEIWRRELHTLLGFTPDWVFAGELYGRRLAEELGAGFMPLERACIAVSGTAVRADPGAYWDHLSAPVRAYYRRRICVFGPESTGKTTLAADLAAHYGTTAVPEYARTYLEAQDGRLAEDDLSRIARGTRALEAAMAPTLGPLAVLDTDVLATTIWQQALYGRANPALAAEDLCVPADFYLLTGIDVPWEPDPVRYLPDHRASFYRACVAALTARGLPFAALTGDRATRLRDAVAAVEAWRATR